MFTSPILPSWTIPWEGLKTYEECKGALGDVLTLSRRNPQSHSYVAGSTSQILREFHPTFGSQILDWVVRLCKNSPKRQGMIVFDRSNTLIVLSGTLEAFKLKLTLITNSEAFAIEVKSTLAWILTVLQPRKDEKGLFCVSWDNNPLEKDLPNPVRFAPAGTESYCWTNLFSNAIIVDMPPSEALSCPDTDGLEVDLDLLIELAAVDREVLVDGALIMYGFDTAIFPLEPPESRRWHFLVTEGRQITPMRVKQELNKRKLRACRLTDRYRTGTVYVGWCPDPMVTIGSSASDDRLVQHVFMSSGIYEVSNVEELSEKSSSRDLTFLTRAGFLGSALGCSSGRKREKKFKQISVVAKRTEESNFERILTVAQIAPCILWDQSVGRAWLLPTISALLFASVRFVEWKEYAFKKQTPDGQYAQASISYAQKTQDTGRSAEAILRQNDQLLVDSARSIPVSEEITFKDIVRDIWQGMSAGEDACSSEISGRKLQRENFLYGYDLMDAICSDKVPLRGFQATPAMNSWQPLTQVKSVQIIFCKRVGDVLACACTPKCYSVDCAQSHPRGVLSCLLQDLILFYGEAWDVALGEPSSGLNPRGLPVGDGYEWIPKIAQSVQNRLPPCNMQNPQSITPRPSRKKLQKKNSIVSAPPGVTGSNAAFSLVDPALVAFGHVCNQSATGH
ncbi:hypothetical protein AOQ84DRAFT_387853 [Glonium stellatum]|uniref:Uncharacterized protein n=1 Tax=Glonium stellatum TaxID=574774 RepID=A0A8E2F4Q4_9PEZI|nr:hypothetical protein AOQ84DRAFT_387853 [Glonium stellatum]